ncbi:MAG: type II toxin-antitoxin system RelE/ParE family toxin [Elusimicrobia bacterium]|nr:type II toxin-antitoxin system RelE/ParE family toxin [Elusimicrobiota bacterium]
MYRIELARHAEKQIEKIYRADRRLYERFLEAFEDIRRYPSIGKPLKHDLKCLRSHRLGSYRILYQVHQGRLLILIIDLGHRREIYQ